MAKLQSYALSVALTKMKHSIITAKSGQKCLVLPIDDNYLTSIEKDGVHSVFSSPVNFEICSVVKDTFLS